MAEIRSGRGGRLAIGAIMGAIPDCVVPVLNELHASQPNLSIEIVEDTSARMLLQLDEGRLDLVIGRAAVSADPSRYQYQSLGDEPLSVVVGYASSAHVAQGDQLRDLAGHRWVTYPGHMPLHALLEREMDLAGMSMPVSPISTASTFVTVALLQQAADLVSVLPTGIAELFAKQKMLRILPVKLKSQSQTFGIVSRKGGVLSPPAEQFISCWEQKLAAEESAGMPTPPSQRAVSRINHQYLMALVRCAMLVKGCCCARLSGNSDRWTPVPRYTESNAGYISQHGAC